MNEKKIACLVLVMVIAGIVYGTQTMQNKTADMLKEAESANSDFESARSQCDVAEISLKRRTEETRDLRQFLSTWEPIINRFQSSQDAEQVIMRSIRNNSLLTLSQKFEVRENRTYPMVPKSLLASLTIQDDFAKTLNWLGEIERTIPVARVSSCRLKNGDAGRRVNLEVRIEIPLINLQAPMEEPKKK